MIENRGPECGSLICGTKGIERLWRDAYNCVTGIYHEPFSFMEDKELLDPFNKFNLAAL